MNGTQQPDRRGTVTSGSSPEEIQQDIERTRAQLGETADALVHKLNPKTQAKEKAAHVRARGDAAATHARAVTRNKAQRAQQAVRDLYRRNPVVVLGAAAGVTALVVVAVVWRRNS
jgi:phage protein D